MSSGPVVMVENVGIGVGLGPRSRIPSERREDALDAAALLQVRRSEVAAMLARGRSCEARIVARGVPGINDWMQEDVHSWRELHSVRPAVTVPNLRVSLPTNRQVLAGGLRMVSLFDLDGCEPAARVLIANEEVGTYLFGVGPVQMKIVDRQYVLLQGPFVEGEGTLMAVTASDCLAAAWRYWHAAVAASYPANEEVPGGFHELTARQRQVAALLAVDTRDDAIGEALGVSVRTIRADIAHLMKVLGVRSRFAAGARFRELFDEN